MGEKIVLVRSSQQLLGLRPRPLKGFPESTECSSRVLILAMHVASGTKEIQGQRKVWRTRNGCPRTPSKTTDANLGFFPVKTHFTLILDCIKPTE